MPNTAMILNSQGCYREGTFHEKNSFGDLLYLPRAGGL